MSRLAGFTWVANARSSGGTYAEGYPWRIGLHTMEGWLNANTAAGHGYPPQLWYSPRTRLAFQTVPLDRSGFALYQPAGAPHPTNRARCVQVEIEGFAAQTPGWPHEWKLNIAREVIVPIVQWGLDNGIAFDLANVPPPGEIAMSATAYAPQRMPWAAWAAFTGVCSHRHVPGNDHWDCGALDVASICALAAQLLGTAGPAPTPTTEDEEPPVYQFHERPGASFGWPGFVHPCFALDSAMARKGEQVVVWMSVPGRDRNVLLLAPSGKGRAALLRWGAPVVFTLEEDHFHSVVAEEDGRGQVRAEARRA